MSGIRSVWVFVIGLAAILMVAGAFAGTPDGNTPAEESMCVDAGLTGAARNLCNAYCEAQDCDLYDQPSCERLRTRLAEHTGTRVFPCDPFCGDGAVNQEFEECDDANNEDCDGCSANCRDEFCGDGVICPGEDCEPPGTVCEDGTNCTEQCLCVSPGEQCGSVVCEPGTLCCNPLLGICVAPGQVCAQ